MIDAIISSLAYETVKYIINDSISEENDSGKPAVRLKNLQAMEVERFIKEWEFRSVNDSLEDVNVVIGRDPELDIPEKYLADNDLSITYYRNNNPNGLLYIQTRVESDEQGLESMFTIQDRNFMDGSLNSESFHAEGVLIDHAWSLVARDRNLPIGLQEKLLDVKHILQTKDAPLPIRLFAAFAYSASEHLVSSGGQAFDDESISEAVGLALSSLGYFPDKNWECKGNKARRLVSNFRFSDLMNASGVDQEPETLRQSIEGFHFRDEDEHPLDDSENVRIRELCVKFVMERAESNREQIPYDYYSQLFTKSLAGLLLGERVEAEIGEADSSRTDEFVRLDITAGLNNKEQDAARAFIEEEGVEEEGVNLCELIKPGTLKILKKIAYPRAKAFSNPFIQLVEVIRDCTNPDYLPGAKLVVRLGRGHEKSLPSIGLFAFLYGPTLQEIADSSNDDTMGIQLEVDPRLITVNSPPDLTSSSDDGDGEIPEPITWEKIPLEFSFERLDGGAWRAFDEFVNLCWKPDDIESLAFAWLMTAADDAPTLLASLEYSGKLFSSLIAEGVQRVISLDSLVTSSDLDIAVAEYPILLDLDTLRKTFNSTASSSGLQIDSMGEYASRWGVKLNDARLEYIPSGSLDRRLKAFLSVGIIHNFEHSRAIMLMTHPVRLRWLATYYEELRALVLSALGLSLYLNEENESYYLEHLEALSPHGQPPLVANSHRTLLVPVSEHGYSETFAAIKSEGTATGVWKSEVDEASLKVISKEVITYLESHPHKADGLSLLFVLPFGGVFPQSLLKQVRKGEWKSISVQCHVLAPKEQWESLVTSFQALETESRIANGARYNSPIQLMLYEWAREEDVDKHVEGQSFDLALVPNFFGDRVDVDEYADSPNDTQAHFDVLYDHPSYIDRDSDSGSVSIVLKPELADDVFEDWSTVNVRLLRSEAIAPSSPEYVDFTKLRVRFEEAAGLFDSLHKCSHWVVTLDHYVGRKQIESLPQKPDVLTVREGVGQNGLYTLVVSSNAGRQFVINRLTRKLEKFNDVLPELDNKALAQNVYDEIRNIAPSLILKSMGVSRVTEEVLGLMVAKRATDGLIKCLGSDHVSIWISLDENAEWFGGIRGVRADLCRFDFYRQEEKLQVGIVVVEGKLRQAYDSHGVEQVSRTMLLLSKALVAKEGEYSHDARLWRQSILNAFDSVGNDAIKFVENSNSLEGESFRLPVQDREDFRSGNYEVRYLEGVYSLCQYVNCSTATSEKQDDVRVLVSPASDIISLITESQREEIVVEAGGEMGDGVSNADENGSDTNEGANDEVAESQITATPVEIPSPVELEVVSEGQGAGIAKLQRMYQTVLDTFSEFKIQVRVPHDDGQNFVEGPAFVRFRVQPGHGVEPKRISEKEEALRLKLGLDADKRIRFEIGGGAVNIDVPKEDADRYYVDAEQMWEQWDEADTEKLIVPLGENQQGEIISVDLSSANSPHLLIGGATGSGKSEALNTILRGMLKYYNETELRLVLIDPKQTELASFEDVPHLLGDIGYFEEDAVECLEDAVGEMQKRYTAFKAIRARSLPDYNSKVDATDRIPWIVIVLDEYADLVSDPDARKAIEGRVRRLSQKARACGIHIIIATQKPSAENLSTTIRSNLPAQLALKCRGATESRIIMDESGAEALNGKGDAFFRTARGIERIQCALYAESCD